MICGNDRWLLTMRYSFFICTLGSVAHSLNRKSNVCLPTILDNTLYSEEVNFAYRVYSRSNSLSEAHNLICSFACARGGMR
jgi:hypothetical protein